MLERGSARTAGSVREAPSKEFLALRIRVRALRTVVVQVPILSE